MPNRRGPNANVVAVDAIVDAYANATEEDKDGILFLLHRSMEPSNTTAREQLKQIHGIGVHWRTPGVIERLRDRVAFTDAFRRYDTAQEAAQAAAQADNGAGPPPAQPHPRHNTTSHNKTTNNNPRHKTTNHSKTTTMPEEETLSTTMAIITKQLTI